MAVTVAGADVYIASQVIDVEDWESNDSTKKQRIVNVAERTLLRVYPLYTIPDGAVYEFSAILAVVFSDVGRLQTQGVTQFSINATAAFTFKPDLVTRPGDDLAKYIPQSALDLISEANGGVALSKRRVGWTVL